MLQMNKMMKQFQKLQQDMARVQEELSTKTVEATAGGGVVSVVVNGKQEVMSIRIEKTAVDPEDVEMLQDLVLAAVNEGLRKSQELATNEMSKVTSGLNVPGLPFGF